MIGATRESTENTEASNGPKQDYDKDGNTAQSGFDSKDVDILIDPCRTCL